jgi:hypothetical protein
MASKGIFFKVWRRSHEDSLNLSVPKFFCHCHFLVSIVNAKGELQNSATLTDTLTDGITQQFHRSLPEIFSAVVLFLTN